MALKVVLGLIALAALTLAGLCLFVMLVLPGNAPALGPFALLACVSMCAAGAAFYAFFETH